MIAKEYRRLRALGWTALLAHRAARTLEAWNRLDGHTIWADDDPDDPDEPDARVRLHIVADDDFDLSCDCEDAHCEERQLERAERDGVWGIVGEYRVRDEWEQADSCWGFVGEDWRDSGYDTDIMDETMRAFNKALGSF